MRNSIIQFVIKRDGQKVKFTDDKIKNAIRKAFVANGIDDNEIFNQITMDVVKALEQEGKTVQEVEHIQDVVEKAIADNGYFDVAKAFILYRDERTAERKKNERLFQKISAIIKVTDRENANVGNSPSSKLLQISEASDREYAELYLTRKDVLAAIRENLIYPHDFSWMGVGTTTCVPDFEYVLLKDMNGNTFRVKFDFFNSLMEKYHDLVVKFNNQEILDLEKTKIRYHIYGRTGWTPLNKIARRKMNQGEKLYQLKIRKGVPLHLTENHRIPVIRDNKEILLAVKDVQIGDQVIRVKEKFNETEELDVLDLFVQNKEHLKDIRILNAKKLVQWLRFYCDDFVFARKVSNRSMIEGIKELTLEEYATIANKYPIPYKVKKLLSVSINGSKKCLPAFMPITPELMRLLGYIASEGSINLGINTSTYQISIHNHNEEILEDIRKCIINCFNENPSLRKDSRSKKPVAYAFCGSIYVQFISQVLQLKKSVEEINIPDFVFNTSDRLKAEFLKGLFEGDGWYSEKCIGYTTVSENLAKQLTFLLGQLNIMSNYRKIEMRNSEVVFNKKIYKRKYDNYLVTITDVKNLKTYIDNVTTIKGYDQTLKYVNTTVSANRDDSNKIIDKNVIPYDRYVFDLETGEHWFTVNDYVVHNCTFIPLRKLLKNGFNTGHGYIRPPKRIKSAASLACIIFQSNQNDQHGGQAFGWFDRDMAPYVKREYKWQVKNLKENLMALGISVFDKEKLEKTAWENTEKETFQAMESLVFNLNSMHARAGAQVPFTSINIGTDTSKEARLVSKMLLLAYEKGLGYGEQPLFPNIIFKVKSGINFEPDSPNFDLLLLSLRVTSKRLFPNYVFQDATLNKDFPEDVPVMGCRTRISWNRHKPADEQTCEGRGNLSFTTVNPVGIALKSKYRMKYTEKVANAFDELITKYQIDIPQVYNDNRLVKKFFVELNKNVDIIIDQLLDRFAYQCKFTKQDFPFLMNGVYMDSDKLGKLDTVAEILKHGTLTIGFIGLAETLTCLVGKHHGEDTNADLLGVEIVKFLRKKADEAAELYNLNFSVIATPAEGLCQKLVAIDKEKYGEVQGVTDKAWYTNSFHVPVEHKINLFKKIEIEGKYHVYCNGGQISYIELKESPSDNIEGMYDILKYMKAHDMSYVAMNFPIDRCPNCSHSGLIEQDCPACGTSSNEISRIRRITGYLAELNNFNNGKKEEALHRVSHN